jgi:hypothetical protein
VNVPAPTLLLSFWLRTYANESDCYDADAAGLTDASAVYYVEPDVCFAMHEKVGVMMMIMMMMMYLLLFMMMMMMTTTSRGCEYGRGEWWGW